MKRVMVTCPAMMTWKPDHPSDAIDLVYCAPPRGQWFSAEELLQAGIAECEGALVGDDIFDRTVFSAAPRLKVVSKFGHGTDSINKTDAREFGVTVLHTPGVFATVVADSATAYMVFLVRRLRQVEENVRVGKWQREMGRDIASLTVGVVGVGNIGREFARRASAYGVKLIGADPKAPPAEFLDSLGMRMLPHEELLAQADVISYHCDLNPTSYHLFNRDSVALVKRGAFLINTARGPVVEEAALVQAMESGIIAGAALDVFENEPLPMESRLRSFPNTYFGAHGSYYTAESVHRASERNYHNVVEFFGAAAKD